MSHSVCVCCEIPGWVVGFTRAPEMFFVETKPKRWQAACTRSEMDLRLCERPPSFDNEMEISRWYQKGVLGDGMECWDCYEPINCCVALKFKQFSALEMDLADTEFY